MSNHQNSFSCSSHCFTYTPLFKLQGMLTAGRGSGGHCVTKWSCSCAFTHTDSHTSRQTLWLGLRCDQCETRSRRWISFLIFHTFLPLSPSLFLRLSLSLVARRIRQSQPSCFVVASIVVVIKAAWRAKRYSSSSKVPVWIWMRVWVCKWVWVVLFGVCFLARIVAVLNCNYSWRCVWRSWPSWGCGRVEGEMLRQQLRHTVRIFCCHTCPLAWTGSNNWLRRMRLLQMTFWHASWATDQKFPLGAHTPNRSHPSYAENCSQSALIDRPSAGGGARGSGNASGSASGRAVNTNRKTNRNAHTSNWPTIATFLRSCSLLTIDPHRDTQRQYNSHKMGGTADVLWAQQIQMSAGHETGPVPVVVAILVAVVAPTEATMRGSNVQ